MSSKDKERPLIQDLLNPKTKVHIKAFSEICEKIAVQESGSCLFFNLLHFEEFYHQYFSPAALSLSYFFYLEKNKEEKAEPYPKTDSPQKAPEKGYLKKGSFTPTKVTYLSFSGIYSEMDQDYLTQYGEDNAQIIQIYDERTGGPIMQAGRKDLISIDMREKSIPFDPNSKNVYLIPLTVGDGGKSYSERDMLWII